MGVAFSGAPHAPITVWVLLCQEGTSKTHKKTPYRLRKAFFVSAAPDRTVLHGERLGIILFNQNARLSGPLFSGLLRPIRSFFCQAVPSAQ